MAFDWLVCRDFFEERERRENKLHSACARRGNTNPLALPRAYLSAMPDWSPSFLLCLGASCGKKGSRISVWEVARGGD